MSAAEALDAAHFFFLVGVLAGLLLALALAEVQRGAIAWWRQLHAARAEALRCKKTWECLDPDGHPGDCINVKECD